MEFNTFATIVLVLLSTLNSYILFVLVGHFAIKWNNVWKAGLIPLAIAGVLTVFMFIVALVFNTPSL